jgi:hypothetical protein
MSTLSRMGIGPLDFRGQPVGGGLGVFLRQPHDSFADDSGSHVVFITAMDWPV